MKMLVKLLFLGTCVLLVAQLAESGYWLKIGTDLCIGSRGEHYKQFTYTGSNCFTRAMKLVHKTGQIGCSGSRRSNWGCGSNDPIHIIVTDTRNRRIYPSPTQVSLRRGGAYHLPGYGPHSSTLVFVDPGFRYLTRWERMRIWYGEDLYDYTEGDNHGFTCMDVYVYVVNF